MADVAEVKGLVKALNAAAAGQGTTEVCMARYESASQRFTDETIAFSVSRIY